MQTFKLVPSCTRKEWPVAFRMGKAVLIYTLTVLLEIFIVAFVVLFPVRGDLQKFSHARSLIRSYVVQNSSLDVLAICLLHVGVVTLLFVSGRYSTNFKAKNTVKSCIRIISALVQVSLSEIPAGFKHGSA